MLDRAAACFRPAARRLAQGASLAVLLPGMFVLAAAQAGAVTDEVAPARDPALAQVSGPSSSSVFGVFGPVGLAAVVLGLGGLCAGLVRHRRAERVERRRAGTDDAVASGAVAQETAARTVESPVAAPGTVRPGSSEADHPVRAGSGSRYTGE